MTSPFRYMMTSSNGNFFRVSGHLCGDFTDPGEFPAQRPVTRSFDDFLSLCLNKRVSKQSGGSLFETPSRPLWRHCNDLKNCHILRSPKVSCVSINVFISSNNLAYRSRNGCQVSKWLEHFNHPPRVSRFREISQWDVWCDMEMALRLYLQHTTNIP